MLGGATLLAVGTALGPLVATLPALMILWALLGAGFSLTQTPSGRLLRRSAHAEDRPALFAAQFALSHACWLVAYPLAGQLGARAGLDTAFIVLAGIAALSVAFAVPLWPADEAETLPHSHPDLPPDHPHLRQHGRRTHRHPVIIDDLHWHWPKSQSAENKS